SLPTILPTCCVTCRTKRRRGKICASRVPLCSACTRTQISLRPCKLRCPTLTELEPARPSAISRFELEHHGESAAYPAMKEETMRNLFGRQFGVVVAAVVLLSGCGYNDLQRQDEQVKSAWSEVLNQYQRRADLVPNLVNTVKGYAAQEERVLTEVTNARASVGSIKATPELINDPEAFAKFQAAQGQLQSALSRLLVVAENYPDLKSNQNFRDLQSQLEGTENRITVARNRYIK